MELGFGLPVCGAWATPDNALTVARRAEELGYASLWTIQRLIYAHEPRTEYYGAPGGRWPEYFHSVVDPIVAMSFVASATRSIRLGSAVLNTPFTNPVLFAKQLATLELLSGGRLDAGVGLGWARDEYDEYTATGAPWERRGARFDEFVATVLVDGGAEEAHEQRAAGELDPMARGTSRRGPHRTRRARFAAGRHRLGAPTPLGVGIEPPPD